MLHTPASVPELEQSDQIPSVHTLVPSQIPEPQGCVMSSIMLSQLLSIPSQSSSAPGCIAGLLSLQSTSAVYPSSSTSSDPQ